MRTTRWTREQVREKLERVTAYLATLRSEVPCTERCQSEWEDLNAAVECVRRIAAAHEAASHSRSQELLRVHAQ